MCGIFFSCHQADQDDNFSSPEILSKLTYFLKRRGPDAIKELTFHKNDFLFKFIGSVLHLRGIEVVEQPIYDYRNNALIWNGEMFNHGTDNEDESDTLFLFNQLNNCHEKLGNSVYEVISNIRGPFALVYWSDLEKSLYFGRDFIGRRSLCWKKVDKPFSLSLSSVCPPDLNGWEEVPASGIFKLNFSEKVPTLQLTEWSKDAVGTIISHNSALHSPINTTLNSLSLEECPDESYIGDDLVSDLIQTLSDSIKTRIIKFNQLCQMCVENSSKICNHSSVAVLFSGGLDSSIIALLSDRYVPQQQSIDLINVAFSSQAQDRLTGFEAFDEIKAIRPERKWNFLQVDVTLETLRTLRNEHIKHLVKPLNTVLDDSIACAVWFAARGEGVLRSQVYKSPARIVLLGMGADEQLAGYSRHRAVFQSKGWIGLTEEIKHELTRISKRNLGRDDRIVSDHGREARFPYLDENVINFLNSLPTCKKANLKLERGKGEKLLLRLAAKKLGLIKISGYWKRAIQFGSRIARLENCKEKGSDQCARLAEYT